MDRLCLLLHSAPCTSSVLTARFRMEIVRTSRLNLCYLLNIFIVLVIDVLTTQHPTTLLKNFKSIISLITALVKNSKCILSSLVDLQPTNILRTQISEGNQEGPRGATDATKQGVRV